VEFFKSLLFPDFMPHGYCYLWDSRMVWLHVISDGLIALSYYCIPLILVYFIRKNRDLPFDRIFWMFGTFILACGTTHVMEIWNVWHGSYLLAGVVKAIAAAVSVITVAVLIPLVPRVMSLPGRIHLQEENRKLEQEIAERNRIDAPIEAPLRRKVKAGFAVAVLLTGLLGLLSWRIAQQAAENSDWVAHTHEVITTLEVTLRHLVDVESGARGFAMTGSEPFLEPHETGKYAVSRDLQALRLLLVDNPDQQRRLNVLDGQANARIEAAKKLVALRQNTRTIPTELQLEQGKQIMDATRATVERMVSEEKQLLEQRSQHTRSAQRFTISVIGLGSLLGVVFLSIAGVTVSREVGISARARAQVNALNADLERRVAERTEALGDSEGRLAGVIQSAMDSILTVDEQQKILLFNAAAERMFRCPAVEALGQPITRFIPQRFHATHAGHIHKFGETGVTNRAMGPKNVLWAVRADGQEFQIEASISQVVTGGKKLFTVILRDVTERVKAEEVREHLAAVVDSSDDAIVGKDMKGTINAWNRGAEKIFGYPASEAMGKPMLMLIPPDRLMEESDILARIRKGESVEHFETVRVRKDGGRIDVSVTISPIRDSSGTIVGASKIARDITERKQAEEALRQSDARRRFALETAKLGDWELDLTTLQATRSLLHDEIFGYESLLPEWSFDIFLGHVHPDDRERVRENFQRCVSEGKKWEFECRIVCPNGDLRWIWACGDHYRGSSGHASHMFGIVADITERKRTEEGLREQAQVMDSAQVFVRDMESRVVSWPGGAEKLYGFSSQEALGILSHDLFHTQFLEPLEMIEKKLTETGEWEGELIHRKRDGGTIVVSSAWVLHRDSQGQPVRILETNIDITERKRATEKLAEQAAELAVSRQALESQTLMLQSVLDSMSEGLVAADEQGKFVLWNPAAERILGMGAANLPSQKWTEHYGLYMADTVTPFPANQIPLVRAIRGEVSTTEMFVRNPELVQGGWIEVSSGPRRDKHGVVCGGVAAFRDITQRKADEREIRELNEGLEHKVVERTAQLEAANKELEAFSYSVSHDLRAPLRHISGFSKMLVEEFGPTLDPTAQHYLDRIQSGTQKMGLLVDELLNLARVGRYALNRQPTKLNSIVTEVIAILQPESEGRPVEWILADLPAVECDPVLVKQIFQNLLANALKFTRPRADGNAQAGTPSPPSHTVIEVSHKEVRCATSLHGPRQRRRLQHEVCRQIVRSLPAAAPRGRLRRHWHRLGHGAADRSQAWRPSVGGGRTG
jgi:PAS domain S-box-containing protein